MSTVRIVALGALMIAGFAGVSGAQASSSTPSTRPDSGWHRRGPGGAGEARGERGARGEKGFARDLNLTDAQKAQIKAIRQKYQPQNQAVRDRAKPFMEAARAARQKGDSAAVRSNIVKAREVMQGRQTIRTQENAEIRNVLTADQRVKFDAWQKQMADRRAQGAVRGGKGFGRRKGGAGRAGK
jgi:protein CpxP